MSDMGVIVWLENDVHIRAALHNTAALLVRMW